VLSLAILASRNIPGLVDALLLGQLGVDSPTRYAISTLTRYLLVAIGILAACNLIGITWNNAQWLVAALGVGLGFGLQEIVANFICGILVLFERPIRVGDVVTLGETTGVVTRIRSRATTVRNWDRQEVIIPNKELITGRIINWTLDDEVNRIILTVGVAYGTDMPRARELLHQIIDKNSNVLKDPRPTVTVEQFADSSVTFFIRAFLGKVDERLETIHQLYTTIHQRFSDEGIEIAFPQRDLHIRLGDPATVEAIAQITREMKRS
jgi:potassium efflux system protein